MPHSKTEEILSVPASKSYAKEILIRTVSERNGDEWFRGKLRDSVLINSPITLYSEAFYIWICAMYTKGDFFKCLPLFRTHFNSPGFRGVITATDNIKLKDFIIRHSIMTYQIYRNGLHVLLADPRGTPFFNRLTHHEETKIPPCKKTA